MALYKPARGISQSTKRRLQTDFSDESYTPGRPSSKDELRVLACAHGPGNVPGLINLIESTRTIKSQLRLYIMHLVELTERSSSIIMVQRLRRNGVPFIGRPSRRSATEVLDRVGVAFETYGQLGRVVVRPVTAVSTLATMHEDICHVAEQKRVTLIMLPFHKIWRVEDDEEVVVDNLGHGWRSVNQHVMKEAPCSVVVLVDRGLGNKSKETEGEVQNVCVIFFGGPDDRESLELGGRMAEHPASKVTVIRFVERQGNDRNDIKLRPSPEKNTENSYTFSKATMNREEEKVQDDAAVAELRRRWEGVAEYTERVAGNIVEDVLQIGRSGEYKLIVVGKGRFPSIMVAELADRNAEHAELGPIGDILTSSNSGVVSSVLVVQQHDIAHADEVPVSKVVHNEDQGIDSQV